MLRLGIVGLGLIGGSLALDFRAAGHYLVGVSRQQATCDRSLALGIVDEASIDLKALATCDVVFLCTPLHQLVNTARVLIPHLMDTAILTDVGSAKGTIVTALDSLWPRFVGGHPMAGKAERGLEVAEAGLFAENPYVVTPIDQTDPGAIEVLRGLIQQLKARYYTCSPTQHDRAVAWISHLPVLVSAGLIQACDRETDPHVLELAQNLASSGFRDTSRVGGGVPELGLLMAQYNREALLGSLQNYRQVLDELIHYVSAENWDSLEAVLKATEQNRPKFL